MVLAEVKYRKAIVAEIAMGQAHEGKVEVAVGVEGSPHCIKSLV